MDLLAMTELMQRSSSFQDVDDAQFILLRSRIRRVKKACKSIIFGISKAKEIRSREVWEEFDLDMTISGCHPCQDDGSVWDWRSIVRDICLEHNINIDCSFEICSPFMIREEIEGLIDLIDGDIEDVGIDAAISKVAQFEIMSARLQYIGSIAHMFSEKVPGGNLFRDVIDR